jgi:pyridoxine 5-phosphate synthase
MTKLSVNVNKVATLRNTRTTGIPNVVHAARLCLDAGADGITIHPRPDQRHIRPADVHDLAMLLKGYPPAELNIEGNPFHEYMYFTRDVRPNQCTLVPDENAAATSDHGWDLRKDGERLRPILKTIQSLGCRVSLFIDPDPCAVELAAQLGVERIELYTAPYAEAFAQHHADAGIEPYVATARRASELGLQVNAGHDLSLKNLAYFLRHVPGVAEVSIGHALIADALEYGLGETVGQYLEITRGITGGITD